MGSGKDFSEKLVSYLKEKGFVYGPEPEIYNGLAGFYSYGPLGKRLKNNIEKVIREYFNAESFYEVEFPIVSPAIVWKASGHLDGFNDPIIFTEDGKESYRADKLLEEMANVEGANHLSDAELLKLLKEKNVKAPGGKKLALKIERFSLMMKTTVGKDTEAYNRPETATTTYLSFKNYVNFFRDKLPFGVFQIGKAFRNEISPRQHLLRSREFTQAESQTFLFPEMKKKWPAFEEAKKEKLPLWTEAAQKKSGKPEKIPLEDAISKKILKNEAFAWHLYFAHKLFLGFGIPEEKIRLRQHFADERAFYSDDTWDLEVELNSFGWVEVCGISDRTDYDLKQHSKFSNENLVARTQDGKEETPHVIEVAFGVDRPFFALLDLSFGERVEDEKRTLMKFSAKMAPIQIGIYPLVKKDGLAEKASGIYRKLAKKFLCIYDESGSIGRRYARQDSVGTPYGITIDYETMEKDTVTLRDRDSMGQERVKVSEIEEILEGKLNG